MTADVTISRGEIDAVLVAGYPRLTRCLAYDPVTWACILVDLGNKALKPEGAGEICGISWTFKERLVLCSMSDDLTLVDRQTALGPYRRMRIGEWPTGSLTTAGMTVMITSIPRRRRQHGAEIRLYADDAAAPIIMAEIATSIGILGRLSRHDPVPTVGEHWRPDPD